VLYIRGNVIIPEYMKRKGMTVRVIANKHLWTQEGLARETWRDKLDVLFVPAHTLPIWRKLGIKTVVTIHGLEYRWLPEYRNWLQRWYLPLSTFYAAKKADKLIAVSRFTRRQLIKELGVEARKIAVIYEGVEPDYSASLGGTRVYQKYGIQVKQYILFVGTLQPRKNLRALVKAFELMEQSKRARKLVLAGGVGWLTREIFQAVNQSKVAERIVITGRVSQDELRGLYRGASLYVQPSFQEGFGLPILEAMRVGVPVVTSDGGAIPEIVGEAGRIVKLGRGFEERLADELEKGLKDEGWRARATKNSKSWSKQFSWEKAAEKTLKVLVE